MEAFLEVRNITKSFSHHVALDDVSIKVPQGKIFGLLGPNGAGKTTLIRVINRITMPDKGEVLFQGRAFRASDVIQIGYLPEERGLYKKMKVGEQAIYLAQLKGLSRKEAKRRLELWFDKFGIMPWWNKKLEELSKGMQQKVQFVTTVLHEPPLLIFDEPFSGFDPVNAELLKHEIHELKRKGHTIVFSTHNMASVEEVCDEFALINNARLVLEGNVQQVRSQYGLGLYEVVVTGTLLQQGKTYLLVSVKEEAMQSHYFLKRRDNVSTTQMIQEIAGQVELHSFVEQRPSMNDIFIQTVQTETL